MRVLAALGGGEQRREPLGPTRGGEQRVRARHRQRGLRDLLPAGAITPFSTRAIAPRWAWETIWLKVTIFSRAGVCTHSTPTTPRAMSRSSFERGEP